MAVALLYRRTLGDARLGRSRSTISGNGLNDQGLAVFQPLNRIAENGVQSHAFHAMRLPGSRITQPQLDPIGDGVREGELLPIGRPLQRSRARVRRKSNRRLRAFR